LDIFGQQYDRLPGDEKKRKIHPNLQIIESWEGNLASEDQLLKKQKDISQLVPDRKFSHLYYFYALTVLFGLVLFGRLWQLQIVKGEESLKTAEGNIIHVKTTYAPRGVLYDRHGEIITGNTSRYDLKVIPAMLPEDDRDRYHYYQEINNIINLGETNLRDLIEQEGLYNWNEIVVVKNLDRDQALVLKTKNLPGFFVENISSRLYYCDSECAHVLGYTGQVTPEQLTDNDDYQPIDQVGKSGLELYYENELKGKNGAEYQMVDATGQITNILTPKNSEPGNNLITTLDSQLQKTAYQQLMATIDKNPAATGGAVVVSDPNNGEILALVSAPSFSSNQMSTGLTQAEYDALLNDEKLPLFNRSITGEYPPGSTFKIVTASGILSENLATPAQTVIDEGSIRIVNKYDPSIIYIFWGWDHAGLGPVNIVDALALSSDIYFYIFGGGYEDIEGLGIDRLQKYAEKYMISKTLGIDLLGESPGFIPTPDWKLATKGEEWYLGDDYNTAIGQGDILTTPLQINAVTAAIANGGNIYRPHLIKSITDADGQSKLTTQPEVISQNIISSDNIAIIRQGLENVVTNGTAKIMQSAPVSVAGKTGTAQYANNEKEHAWFTCYAPADNPQIAVTVFVEGGGEGSDAAAPIALEIINSYFKHS